MPPVELVYDKDCPNVAEARQNLRRAFAEVGVPARWSEREASSPETPAHLRGFGSPTILVNGRDVAGAEPGEASSCRVYEVGAGRPSGVPPPDMIARALAAAEAPKHRGWWRALLVAPAAGVALLPSLTCPACWPGYAAVLSALGVGFIPTAPSLLPLTVVALAVALVALAVRARSGGWWPFGLGLVAAAVILLGKFVFASNATTYTGVGLLVAASLWNTWRPSTPAIGSCPSCAPSGAAWSEMSAKGRR